MGVEELLGGTILSSMVGSKGVPCPTADPPVIVAEQFLESNWNLFASMDQHVEFIVPTAPSSYTPGMQEHPGISRSNGCPMEQIPGFKFFDNGKIMCPFGPPEDGDQVTSSLLPTESLPSEEQDNEKDSKGKKRRRMPESGALGSLSQFCGIQTAEAEHKKDVKKEKGGKIPGAIAHKLASEQVKGSSSSGDDPKEDYVHVRAKRGQATNSHSLAERVRREKISQRMKFLQDLVPGCNKITGKAVMLDEIINYVQSLQQQVEFLSMKLATVNPEMHFEIEQALSTGVLYSQTGNPGLPVIGTGFNASHFHFQRPFGEGVMQAQTVIDSNADSGESSNVWDDDLQNVMQMDFVSNAHIDAAAAKSPASVKMKQ